MKYKVGDKVKIKTWDQMAEEFEVIDNSIKCECGYKREMEKELLELNTGRILTIREIVYDYDYYRMEEDCGWSWSEDMIEGLYKDTLRIIDKSSIIDRFNLMVL